MRSKALLLLFIFLLNTATGFACALRMSIHEQEEATEHHHEGDEVAEYHHAEHQQVSQLSVHQHQVFNGTYIAEDDPCCQGAVNNFNALAKVSPPSNPVILLAPFIYIGMDYQFFLKPVPDSNKSNQLSSLNERRRPPTHPIRIAIQSFQI
ncbi:MAG: hypothetical protein V4577_09415 [Bacteroidota bacterium]